MQHDTQDANIMTWHFQPTPPMSTYLVAVVIGNLVSVERTIPAFVPGNLSTMDSSSGRRKLLDSNYYHYTGGIEHNNDMNIASGKRKILHEDDDDHSDTHDI